MCTAVGIVQQNMRWCRVVPVSCRDGCTGVHGLAEAQVVQGLPFFNDSPPSRGARDPSPGGQRTTLPARRVGHGTRYAPGTEKGCCVGGTWRHSETAGGRVELETRSCFLGVLKQKYFRKIQMTTRTSQADYTIVRSTRYIIRVYDKTNATAVGTSIL